MLQNIQTIRDAVSQENQSIALVTDNDKIYSSARDIFIWDDENSLLNILRLNTDFRNQCDKPIIFETFGYENISYMRINSTKSNIDDILELIS